MKISIKIKKEAFCLLLSVFAVMATSCQKESLETVMELPIDSKQKVLIVEKNGVGIEFCLLNEQGEPATVFNEGENFKFHLAIINNVEPDTAMYIVSDFLYTQEPELFEVFNSDGKVIGKPWEIKVCSEISDAVNQIKQGEKWIMESPWTEERIFTVPYESNTIKFLQCYFSGLNMKPLTKGKYYTLFSYHFCLGKYLPHPQNQFVCTDILQLKINFEIQ